MRTVDSPFDVWGKTQRIPRRKEMVFGRGASGASTIAAPFASVNGATQGPSAGPYDSWSVQYASQPTISANVPFTVSRQGYTGSNSSTTDTSATTTYLDTMYVTKSADAGGAVRQPYPNQTSQSALTAALSDYIYSTDTPSGSATNNASFTSPVPVANWALTDRRVVGNTLHLEVVAFHRNARAGKQVACVVFTATDGTNTVTATVATPTVLAHSGDLNPVIGYAVDLDITGLTNPSTVTANAKVYPWIGAGASVADSSTGAANSRDFCPQVYRKDTTKAATPVFVYVISGGTDAVVDANGANGGNTKVSTTAATAKTNGFATIASAINALKAATNVTGGITDGCRLRISNVSVSLAAATGAGTYQNVAELVIERDPLETKASCILSFGGAAQNSRQQWIRFYDLTISRTGTGAIMNTIASGKLVMESCNFANGGGSNNIWGGTGTSLHMIGVPITGGTSALMSAGGNNEQRLIRGVSSDAAISSVEPWLVLGSNIPGVSLSMGTSRSMSGAIVAFSKFLSMDGTSTPLFIPQSAYVGNISGVAIAQNVFEFVSAADGPTFRPSGDGNTQNIDHLIFHNNTLPGAWLYGRGNILYDEGATQRTHRLQSFVGNIHTQINTKSDVFKTNGVFIGNWGYMYAVGCSGEWVQYIDASSGGLGTSFAQSYGGVGSSIGTSSTTPQMATSNFTTYAATTWNGTTSTAGAGNGVYSGTLASVKSTVPVAVLAYDLAGTARPTTLDTAGAYVAP